MLVVPHRVSVGERSHLQKYIKPRSKSTSKVHHTTHLILQHFLVDAEVGIGVKVVVFAAKNVLCSSNSKNLILTYFAKKMILRHAVKWC